MDAFLIKAKESLLGAESEFANSRCTNCANRCYYACFHAAIAALLAAGITPTRDEWHHDFVQSSFVNALINRRKRYDSSLRDVLAKNINLRLRADYEEGAVSQKEAQRALDRARMFVREILEKGGNAWTS